MMRATADPKATSTTLLALSCVLLIAAVALFLIPVLYPGDTPAQRQSKEKAAARKEQGKTRDAQIVAEAAKRSVEARTWIEEPADMTGQIVILTATLAKQRNVNILRLSPPAKATVEEGLEQYPYLLVVEGSFPNVAALERDLEASANRLAVNSFQVTSSDSQSDKVSASIGLVAHRVAVETTVGRKKP